MNHSITFTIQPQFTFHQCSQTRSAQKLLWKATRLLLFWKSRLLAPLRAAKSKIAKTLQWYLRLSPHAWDNSLALRGYSSAALRLTKNCPYHGCSLRCLNIFLGRQQLIIQNECSYAHSILESAKFSRRMMIEICQTLWCWCRKQKSLQNI